MAQFRLSYPVICMFSIAYIYNLITFLLIHLFTYLFIYHSLNYLFTFIFPYHHYHMSFMELGHLLTRSGLTYPEVS